jgi:hypothetical protein
MTEALKRRRFRFSLRTLFLAATAAAVVAFFVREYLGRNGLQGTWQGTGEDQRYWATFSGDTLTMRRGTSSVNAPVQSSFDLDVENGTIDILRDDGMQLGRYQVDGDTLTLKLSDVNRARPPDLTPHGPFDRQRRYVFKRVR